MNNSKPVGRWYCVRYFLFDEYYACQSNGLTRGDLGFHVATIKIFLYRIIGWNLLNVKNKSSDNWNMFNHFDEENGKIKSDSRQK